MPTQGSPRPSPLAFRPDIEGLRAVAVLLVVAFHAGVPGVTGGFIGVDVFFVVSGFLITGLLLQEVDRTGTVDPLAFYARRVRRLLPASLAMQAVTVGVALLLCSPLELLPLAQTGLATAGFASNLHFMAQAGNYFAASTQQDPLLHTWSLAVEEQFYLVWPWIVRAVYRRARDRRRLRWALGLLVVGSCAGGGWYLIADAPVAFYLTPLRGWEFAAGGLLAIPCGTITRRPLPPWVWTVAGWAGAALIGWAGTTFSPATAFPGTAAMLPVAGTLLLLWAAPHDTPGSVGGLLTNRPMQWIGQRSYAIYLWHWPVLILGARWLSPAAVPSAPVRGLLVAAAVLLATLSFRLVETPWRRARGTIRTTLSAGLLGTAVALGAMLLFRARAEVRAADPAVRLVVAAATDGAGAGVDACTARWLTQTARLCEFGPADGVRVALVGDSHAAQWVPALQVIAERRHWRLTVALKSGCPYVDVRTYSPSLKRAFRECAAWRSAVLDSLTARPPRMTILSSYVGYVRGQPVNDGDSTIAAAAWSAGVLRTLRRLQVAGTVAVVIEDIPTLPVSGTQCLARLPGREIAQRSNACAWPLASVMAGPARPAEAAAARAVPGTVVISLADAICPTRICRAREGDVVTYRDGNHLTGTFSRQLAPALDEALARSGALIALGHP